MAPMNELGKDESARRLVVLLPTWVGDAVMATPALAALRRRFAAAHIAWMGGRAALDVLAGLDLADEMIPDAGKTAAFGVFRAARQLREGRFDLAVFLSNSFRAALTARLGRVAKRAGYARDGRGWLLTRRLAPPRKADGRFEPIPAIRYYLALAESLGCDTTDRTMRLAVEDRFAEQADELFRQARIDRSRPVVVINPGASFGSSKLWAPERFAAVADALRERHGAQIVINAGPNERAIAGEVGRRMKQPPEINFAERENSLGLLKAITARAALMITGDTGPRHIAAALGTGVVTIFGSTDPDWTTIDYAGERIVRVDVPCGPCQKKLCPLPLGSRHHQCMRLISPEMVLAAAEEVLTWAANRAREVVQ
jgi:heptosyltransferase II